LRLKPRRRANQNCRAPRRPATAPASRRPNRRRTAVSGGRDRQLREFSRSTRPEPPVAPTTAAAWASQEQDATMLAQKIGSASPARAATTSPTGILGSATRAECVARAKEHASDARSRSQDHRPRARSREPQPQHHARHGRKGHPSPGPIPTQTATCSSRSSTRPSRRRSQKRRKTTTAWRRTKAAPQSQTVTKLRWKTFSRSSRPWRRAAQGDRPPTGRAREAPRESQGRQDRLQTDFCSAPLLRKPNS